MERLAVAYERAFLVRDKKTSNVLECLLAGRPVEIKKLYFGGRVSETDYWRIYVLYGTLDSLDRIDQLLKTYGYQIDVFEPV